MNLYYQQKGLVSYPTKPISVEGCANFKNLTDVLSSDLG